METDRPPIERILRCRCECAPTACDYLCGGVNMCFCISEFFFAVCRDDEGHVQVSNVACSECQCHATNTLKSSFTSIFYDKRSWREMKRHLILRRKKKTTTQSWYLLWGIYKVYPKGPNTECEDQHHLRREREKQKRNYLHALSSKSLLNVLITALCSKQSVVFSWGRHNGKRCLEPP